MPAIVLKIVVRHVPYIAIVSLEVTQTQADKRFGLTGHLDPKFGSFVRERAKE